MTHGLVLSASTFIGRAKKNFLKKKKKSRNELHDPSTILLQYLNIIIINERYTHKIKKLLNLLVLDSFSFFFFFDFLF